MKIFFVQFFCVFLPPLFKISSASVRSYHFCPLLCPSLHEMFPWYLYFSWRGLCVHAKLLSHVPLFVTPWTIARQASLSIVFSRQEYWSGLPCPPPGERSLVLPIVLFSSISLHWSLRKAFLSLLDILWNSAFRWVYLSFSPLLLAFLLFSAICKSFSDNHFAFLHFFFLGMVLITASYTTGGHKPPSIVPQALCHQI